MDAEIGELIENAARCYRLAAYCTDQTVAGRLLELAQEYCDRAVALGADPNTLPRPGGYYNPALHSPLRPGSGR